MKYRFDIKIEDILALLCSLPIFIYSWAMTGSDAVSGELVQKILTLLVPLFLILIWIHLPEEFCFTKRRIVITLVLLAYFALCLFYNYIGIGLSRGLTTIACLTLLYQSEIVQSKTFTILKKAVIASCVLGMVLGVLLLLGLHGPPLADPVKSGRQYVSYIVVFFSRIVGSSSHDYWRFCGFYNEPGALGTFCAFFLCADSLDFKKKENIILLIGGAMTLSVAFFVIIGLYAVMRLATDWKYWILILLFVCFYFFVLPNIHTGISVIDTVIERVSFDGDSIAGDHRTNYIMDRLYEETLHSNYIFFGRKLGYATSVSGSSVNLVGASIKTYIIDLGIMGTVLIFAPLFIAESRRTKDNRDGFLFIVISYISLYQRPHLLHNVAYFGIFLCGLSYILQNKNQISRYGIY